MSTTSINMGLTIPTVSVTPGPTYAAQINTSLGVIDQHDHTTGKGVKITPDGLNITSNLSFQSNNAIALRTTRFTAQTSPLTGSASADLGCLYVAGSDLYYNDTSGNQVRLTQSGGVAGSPGSITNLVSPASVTYSAPTFTFQSAVGTAGNLDGRNLTLRNSTAGSYGLTISPPSGMVLDSTITLPSVPASTAFLTLTSAGAITTDIATAGGIQGSNIASRTISNTNIIGSSITGGEIAASTVKKENLAAQTTGLNYGFTNTVGPLSVVASLSYVSTGRPVVAYLYGANERSGVIGATSPTNVAIRIDGNAIGGASFNSTEIFGGTMGFTVPTAGAHTYDVYVTSSANATGGTFREMVLLVYEL